MLMFIPVVKGVTGAHLFRFTSPLNPDEGSIQRQLNPSGARKPSSLSVLPPTTMGKSTKPAKAKPANQSNIFDQA